MARLLSQRATISEQASQSELDAFVGTTNITTLGTVTAGNLANTAIVYPTNHCIYKNHISVTSSGANSDPGDTWTNTSLTLTVPSASADACSSLWIGVSNSMNLEPGTLSYCQARLQRLVSGESDVILAILTEGLDTATWSKHNMGLQAGDSSLVSGEDHVYTYQYRSQAAAHSGRIWYHGYTSAHGIVNMTILGFV